jgi:hypothetical protein
MNKNQDENNTDIFDCLDLDVEDLLESDSRDYDVLSQAVYLSKNTDGMICEIGTRLGGSLKNIIKALISSGSYGKNIISIDPYGNIEYEESEKNKKIKLNYSNNMRYFASSNLYRYVLNAPVNLVILPLEDTEFMQRFADGVPFYNEHKKIETKYSLVFFDGPHSTEAVIKETNFFIERAVNGSIFVYDDIKAYNHSEIENTLFKNGFSLLKYGTNKTKASYLLSK